MSQWKPNLTVAAVIERDGRFLFVEESDDERIVVNQPAGHLEDNESLVAAVCREVREETGLEFEPQAIIGIYRLPLPAKNLSYLRVCFTGATAMPTTPQQRDPAILGNVWLSPQELQQRADAHRSVLVQRCVEDYLAGQRYPLSLLKDP